MTNILTKIIKANQEYEILGGGSSSASSGQEVVYLTQADYDNLTPAEKADTTKNYVIIGQGGIPVPTEIGAEDVDFDNTTSGMTADNVQDAIEEVFQSVSNGKELIAAAITDKGVSTAASDSFQTMADNIGLIETANQTIENIITQNPTLKNGIRIHRTTINSNASNPPVKKTDSEFYTIDHNVYIVGVMSGYNDSKVTGKIICIGTDGIIQSVDTGRCTGYNISFGQVEGESDLIYIYSYSNNYNYAICTYNLSTKQLTQISSPYQITSTVTPYTEPKTVNINLVTDYNQYHYEKIYDYLIN